MQLKVVNQLNMLLQYDPPGQVDPEALTYGFGLSTLNHYKAIAV